MQSCQSFADLTEPSDRLKSGMFGHFTGKIHTSLENQLTITCVGDTCAAQGVVALHHQ